METASQHAGYYIVTLGALFGKRIISSNDERAFVISQLQTILCWRSLLEYPQIHRALAPHIDLLAFSILDTDIRLIVFSISPQSARLLAEVLSESLHEYQQQWRNKVLPSAITIRKLIGPYDALNQSAKLHLRHPDWEYDRYSSIGFYLHDRRGDWMRPWRLNTLYENNPLHYRRLLKGFGELERTKYETKAQPFLKVSHG